MSVTPSEGKAFQRGEDHVRGKRDGVLRKGYTDSLLLFPDY